MVGVLSAHLRAHSKLRSSTAGEGRCAASVFRTRRIPDGNSRFACLPLSPTRPFCGPFHGMAGHAARSCFVEWRRPRRGIGGCAYIAVYGWVCVGGAGALGVAVNRHMTPPPHVPPSVFANRSFVRPRAPAQRANIEGRTAPPPRTRNTVWAARPIRGPAPCAAPRTLLKPVPLRRNTMLKVAIVRPDLNSRDTLCRKSRPVRAKSPYIPRGRWLTGARP